MRRLTNRLATLEDRLTAAIPDPEFHRWSLEREREAERLRVAWLKFQVPLAWKANGHPERADRLAHAELTPEQWDKELEEAPELDEEHWERIYAALRRAGLELQARIDAGLLEVTPRWVYKSEWSTSTTVE